MKAICISALLISLGTLFFVVFSGNIQGVYNQGAVAQETAPTEDAAKIAEKKEAAKEEVCKIEKSTSFSAQKNLYLTDLKEISTMTETNKKFIETTAKGLGLESLIFQSSNVGVSNYSQQPGQVQSVYSVSYSVNIMNDDIEKIIKLLPLLEKAGYTIGLQIGNYTTGPTNCSL